MYFFYYLSNDTSGFYGVPFVKILFMQKCLFFHCLHKIIHYLLNNECYALNN